MAADILHKKNETKCICVFALELHVSVRNVFTKIRPPLALGSRLQRMSHQSFDVWMFQLKTDVQTMSRQMAVVQR